MIFHWLGRMRSFGDKVSWLITLTSGVAILAVCLTLALVDYANLRRETVDSLESQTMIVAMNSGVPLAFADPPSAVEALSVYRARPAVALATLYDVSGGYFASYRRPGDDTPPSVNKVPRGTFVQRWIKEVVPIEDKGQALGRIEVVYDLGELHQHLLRSLTLSALVSLIAVCLVYLFSLRINRVLIRPIALLGDTARRVSETKDYTLRAPKLSDDELGVFTDAFNQMLAQIQKQDLEIQASRTQAIHASQLKDEFLATLSHELRTPMTPILGWAQILQRSGTDATMVQQAAEVIERNARAQSRIVDDLLDMSRIISGKVRLDVKSIDLVAVVNAALDTVAAAADARGILLHRDSEPNESFLIRADPNRLQQVVWNLLSNAIKFTSSGGKVVISLKRAGAQFELAVSDTGQGIRAEFLPHVFERFRQADSSSTRQHAGLGLGLAIVKELVELHGGSVRVASAGENQGSTFAVVLRAAPAEADVSRFTPEAGEADDAEFASALGSLQGVKLLLVDDELDARELIGHMLRNAGAEVVAVGSAREALVSLQGFQADALLSDIGMPEESGYELIIQVRKLPPELGGAIPAIALTAFARPEDRNRALLSGFQQHLAKPVEQADLLAAVSSLIGRKPGRAA